MIYLCWYQNKQIPIIGNGYAITRMGISTGTGIILGPLLVPYQTTGYKFVEITSSSIVPKRGGTIRVMGGVFFSWKTLDLGG